MIKTSFDERSQTKLSLKQHIPKPNAIDIKLSPQFHWHTLLYNVNTPDFIIKYGVCTIIESSTVYIAVGTNKGIVVIYNYHQKLEHVLLPDISETATDLQYIKDLSITSLGFSQDLTHITAGLVNGVIILWEIVTQTPYYTIYPITLEQRFSKNLQGHLSLAITSIQFIGPHNNCIISCDTSGLIFHHVAYKHLLTKTFVSQKLLGKNDTNSTDSIKSVIFDTQELPLGTSEQITDYLGVVAIISGTGLHILSIASLNNPNNINLKTHYKFVKPKHLRPSIGCVNWFPCMKVEETVINARLAFSWNNTLWIVELNNQSFPTNFSKVINDLKDKDKGIPTLPFEKRSKWESDSNIIAVKWTSASLLYVFTDSQNLYTLKYNGAVTVINKMSFEEPLMTKFPQYVSCSSIKVVKNRVILLGKNHSINVGKSISWNDQLVELLKNNHYEQALKTAYYFCTSNDYEISLFHLPDNLTARQELIHLYLLNIMQQSIPHIQFTHEILDIYFSIISLIEFENIDLLFEQVDPGLFFDCIEKYLLSNQIIELTPTILNNLVVYYVQHQDKRHLLTEILCSIDISSLNIDLTIQLCNQYDLKECKIFIYNCLLHDYTTPLLEILANPSNQGFSYLSYILTGRQYPIDKYIEYEEERKAKADIINVLFMNTNEEILFPNLTKLLKFNSFEMLSTLNEYFEDSVLNDDILINRQYIIDSLLDIYGNTHFNNVDKCNLSIFIGRNYPKYSQFLRLSDSLLDQIVDNLINYNNDAIKADCELALQSLLSVFEPLDQPKFIAKLYFKKFYSVLSGIYKNQGNYAKYLAVYIEQGNLTSVNVLEECFENIKFGTEKINLISIVRENFVRLLGVDLPRFVYIINNYDQELHRQALKLDDDLKYEYLTELRKYSGKINQESGVILEYVKLLLRFAPGCIYEYVEANYRYLNQPDLATLKTVLKEGNEIISLSLLLKSENKIQESLDQLLEYLPNSDNTLGVFELYTEMVETDVGNNNTCQENSPEFDFNETYWIKLITKLIEENFDNSLIHLSFKRLSDKKLNTNNQQQSSFLKIFSHILNMDNKTKLFNIKNILIELIVSHSYESEMLQKQGKIVNDSIRHKLGVVKFEHTKAWIKHSKTCTSCNKPIQGDVCGDHYLAWEYRHLRRLNLVCVDRDFQYLTLVLFQCGHGYHQGCLNNLNSNYCVVCSE